MPETPGERIRFDHIALGATRLADAPSFLVAVLGGVPDSGGPSAGFRWATWRYAGGGSLEVIEPHGADGFLHRFLARRGPGVHHVTFLVPSLAAACARAEAEGYEIVGRDESDSGWMTAFLHPKQALGIVVQLAQSAGREGGRPWEVPPGPPHAPPAVRVVGLRLRARDRDRTRVQWATILGGEEPRDGAEDVGLVFRWPGSPMRIAVDLDPVSEAGPVAIEIAADRPLALPSAEAPGLGAVFRQVAAGIDRAGTLAGEVGPAEGGAR
jgi:catechol 2,3-dioxygenase-like lactoylglutathione lyase family enzyme